MARADDGMARVGHDVSVTGCKGVRRSVQIVAAESAAGPGLGLALFAVSARGRLKLIQLGVTLGGEFAIR